MNRAALWLCDAHHESPKDGKEPEGYGAVTKRALKWKAGYGRDDDPQWVSKQDFARILVEED